VLESDKKKPSMSPEKTKEFPFLKTNLVVRVRPIKDVRDISILWSVDPTRDLYRSNPCRLIGFLLGELLRKSLSFIIFEVFFLLAIFHITDSSVILFSLFLLSCM
jgi:secreted Zn-dependent insulinase-like peptidase